MQPGQKPGKACFAWRDRLARIPSWISDSPSQHDVHVIRRSRLLPRQNLGPNHHLPFRVFFPVLMKTAYFFLGSGLAGAAGFKPAAASCKLLTAVALKAYSAGSVSRFAT